MMIQMTPTTRSGLQGDYSFTVNRMSRIDPTRTTGLRLRFLRDVNRRFNRIARDIRTSIVDQDCFGLQPRELRALAAAQYRQFEFGRTDQKIKGFIDWLINLEDGTILEITGRAGISTRLQGGWTDSYIEEAYRQGVRRARSELRRAGYDVTSIEALPAGVRAVMTNPAHAERVALMYTRTFEDLKTVTGAANAAIRRQLTDGLTIGLSRGIAEGKSQKAIARELAKDVNHSLNTIGRTRARMIARTEVVRAHHLANIEEYRQAQVEGVTVRAEVLTAGNPCPICADMAAREKPYTLDEAEGLIPAHVNCVSAETSVIAPDKVAGFIATYTGIIVNLTFASGRRLAVTPNHMLLTPNGFTFAKSLRKGSNVLSCPDFERVIPIDPNDNGNPTRIDNVIKSFSKSGVGGTLRRVPATAIDFHGDGSGCEGNVDVIRTDSFLQDSLVTERQEHLSHLEIDRSSVLGRLLRSGTFEKFLRAAAFAADSSMGRFRETFAASDPLISHPDYVCPTCGSKLNPSLSEHPINRRAATTILLGKLLDRYPGLVETDEIIDVRLDLVDSFHVYDLQCLSTMYVANGLLSSNCRCCVVPVVKTGHR